jgi:hypothetical protein
LREKKEEPSNFLKKRKELKERLCRLKKRIKFFRKKGVVWLELKEEEKNFQKNKHPDNRR